MPPTSVLLSAIRCTVFFLVTTNLRLQAFAFVGITDYWQSSICLFHAMHGGTPRAESFANVRSSESQMNRTRGVEYKSKSFDGTQHSGSFSTVSAAFELLMPPTCPHGAHLLLLITLDFI